MRRLYSGTLARTAEHALHDLIKQRVKSCAPNAMREPVARRLLFQQRTLPAVIAKKVKKAENTRKHFKAEALQRCASRNRANTFQNAASCVVAKLIRISVPGLRTAWNSEPGAIR